VLETAKGELLLKVAVAARSQDFGAAQPQQQWTPS